MELEMKIPADLSQINTNKLGEFIWWAAHLGVGYETLLSAISRVGSKSDAIRKYLYADKPAEKDREHQT